MIVWPSANYIAIRYKIQSDSPTVHSSALINPQPKKVFPVRFVWASSQKGLIRKKKKNGQRLRKQPNALKI